MQLPEARLLAETGALRTPVIRRVAGGWIVELPGKHPLNPVLERARGGPRRFKSLDAAAEVVFTLGGTTLRVEQAPESSP